jgi:hypothetical protein
MDSIHVTLATFAVICVGAIAGFFLKNYLREHHLTSQTQDSVKVATGVVASMTALVLGLLVASAKSGFDARAAEARTFVINVTLLDRSMRLYQPPLDAERQALTKFARDMRDKLWNERSTLVTSQVMSELDQVRNKFRNLDPQTLQDKSLKDRYMSLSDTLILSANELLEQDAVTVPIQMVIIVDAWLALTFFGFALFAPLNGVSVVSLGVGAGAIAMALFMIVEMNAPFQGFITVSPQIMDNAIVEISRA